MAYMGLRLGQRANGVSMLHGEVSRGMFADLWPGLRGAEVPITSVTNGVHAPTWVSREMQELLDREIGVGMDDDQEGWTRIDQVDGGQIWATRADAARPAGRRDPSPAAQPRRSSAARARPSSAGSRPRSTPTCSRSASPAGCRRTSG